MAGLFRFIFLLLLLSPFNPVFCEPSFNRQALGDDSVPKTHFPDTPVRKRFWRGAGELTLVEMTPWLVDQYLRKEDYTHISFQSVADNLKPGSWAWDNDPFVTNQFGHPYHGSLFFNAFRENGYSFWQSVPASFAGSYLWETVAENQAPATNDFINTGFGGVTLGEVTHRLANKLVNNNSRGLSRQVSEVFALLINPVGGFNRILNGQWGRSKYDPTRKDSTKIYTEVDLGLRKFKVDHTDGNFGLYGHALLLYGSPYESNKTPFSYMYINAELGKDDSSLVNIVSLYGSLTGWNIQSTANIRQTLLLTANYDFIRNEAFSYSSQNIKLNLFSTFGLTKGIKIHTTVAGGLVLLAAVPDAYITPDGRDYDFCSGLAFNATGGINIANKFSYTIIYKGAWLKTINGNRSHYLLHTATSEARYRIIDGFSLCAEPGYFTLLGRYKSFPAVDRTYPYLRVSARYSIDFQ